MKPLILWGGTGQSIVIEEFATDIQFEIVAIIENDISKKTPISGVTIFYKIEGLRKFLKSCSFSTSFFAVAIGGDKGRDRVTIGRMLEEEGLTPSTLIHPAAYVSKTSLLGKGCQILAHSTVGARVSIDNFSIINSGASIDHECRLGKGVHIAPGATLTGLVELGNYSFIGAGAVVLPGVTIGKDVVVGAGSVVTRNIPDNTIVKGNPARYVRNKYEEKNDD